MIELIRKNILTSDFIFILILLGFILIVTLLFFGKIGEDNIRLKQINQKVKDQIAGDYSQVLDMQGKL